MQMGLVAVYGYYLYDGKWPITEVSYLDYYDMSTVSQIPTSVSDWNGENIKLNLDEIYNPEYAQVYFSDWSDSNDWGCAIHNGDEIDGYDDATYFSCDILLNKEMLDDYSKDSDFRQGLVTHEIGHCYGLDHNNDESDPPAYSAVSVMNWSIQKVHDDGKYTVQSVDVSAINSKYGAP